jgi:putative addiction module component (TIGR02574 family)
MSERGTQILEQALSLPADERVALVEQLLASLDAPPRPDIDAMWAAEAEDRIDAYERGEISTVSGRDVFEALRRQRQR